MNRKEAMRQTHQMNVLQSLGFTQDEAESLRRISMTLHRWHELECGDSDQWKSWSIERDESTGKPYRVVRMHVQTTSNPFGYSNNGTYRTLIPDRETGARKRLAAIIKTRNERLADRANTWMLSTNGKNQLINYGTDKLDSYIQTDPRGAALYILRPGDVPEGKDVSAFYTNGICVY